MRVTGNYSINEKVSFNLVLKISRKPEQNIFWFILEMHVETKKRIIMLTQNVTVIRNDNINDRISVYPVLELF